jgi:hypothetical protein
MRRPRLNLGAVLPSAVALSVGLITLLGLVGGGAGLGFFSALVDAPILGVSISTIATIFLQITLITVALTIVLGALNLLTVHSGRVIGRHNGFIYSVVLLISYVAVLGLTVFERLNPPAPDAAFTSTTLIEWVQVPIEAALAGLVIFALVYGAYRMMRRGVTWSGVLFIVALLLVLLGEMTRRGLVPISALADTADWFSRVPVSAGARGLLLGIALATAVAAARVLLGQDRSYRE